MMRHDQRPTSPISVDYNHNQPIITTTVQQNHQFRRPADVMRCINEVWRHKSNSPSSSPRSPISKAFDFWPWQRNKKAITLTGHNQNDNTTNNKLLSPDDQNKNIFRNGGIIRDILSDKSNKTKPKDELMAIHRQNNVSSQKKKGRKLSRNKSLDINEIIDEVSNQNNDYDYNKNNNNYNDDNNNNNNENYNHKNKTCFLDDTFIENILRNSQDDDDDDYYYDNNNNDIDDIENNSDLDEQKINSSNDKKHNVENVIPKNCGGNNCQRHILFNDENIVYLIRKEKPVKRNDENTKIRSASLKLKNTKYNNNDDNNNNNNNTTDGNIIKARLKLKKMLSKDDTIDTSKQQQKHHQSLNSNTKLSLSSSPSSSVNKRGILYRYNSIDTNPTTTQNSTNQNNNIKNGNINKPISSTSSSNNDIILENVNSPINNSNNSSGSSIGGNSGSGGGGNDTPKSNRPRKKLSFRDPVVSQRRNELLQQFDKAARNNCRKMISSPINNQHQNCCGNNNNNVNSRNCNGSCSGGGCCNNNKIDDTNMKTNCSMSNDFDLESHAMRIVRTVGQAFEVCHKFNLQKNSLDNNDERSDLSSSEILDADRISEQLSDEDIPKKDQKKTLTRTNSQPDLTTPQRPNHLELLPMANSTLRKSPCSDGDKSPTSPLSSSKEIHKLKEQLEQQAIQTRQALSQLMLVREQLISETNARIEAQARTQQLLQQNRELLEHLASLGGYSEPNQTGLTSANIAMAPQTQIQMLLQEQQQQSSATANDLSATLQKAFLATSNNNNLASINQQLSNLGSINQQLTTLSNQLSGLNQQSQNLQNFQNLNAIQTSQTASAIPTTTNSNAFPSLSQIQTISNKLNNISQQNQHDVMSQKELFQMNQELLNRLHNMNLGNSPNNNSASGGGGGGNSPHNSFFFANPMSNCSPNNNNNNNNNNNFSNFLNTANNMGNLTPSPLGTMSRNSYSNSPLDNDIGYRLDQNLNSNSLDDCHIIKPISQVGTLTTLDSDGKVKVIVPISNGSTGQLISGDGSSCSRSDLTPSPNNNRSRCCDQNDQRYNLPNTVTLKVTDESGNITNTRKLSATPSFITRSTSEKVPNRSQMMSQVQRTAWARHTTK